jgi:hypothetical protein
VSLPLDQIVELFFGHLIVALIQKPVARVLLLVYINRFAPLSEWVVKSIVYRTMASRFDTQTLYSCIDGPAPRRTTMLRKWFPIKK